MQQVWSSGHNSNSGSGQSKSSELFTVISFQNSNALLRYFPFLNSSLKEQCIDPQYKCKNGTCCKNFDGKFGCCPHEG